MKDDPHRFAVVSSNYSRPFLLGAYQKMENAVLAQCGSPEKWHIFERVCDGRSSEAVVLALKEARNFIDAMSDVYNFNAHDEIAKLDDLIRKWDA